MTSANRDDFSVCLCDDKTAIYWDHEEDMNDTEAISDFLPRNNCFNDIISR